MMSSSESLLNKLKTLGIQLTLMEGDLKVRSKKGTLTRELVDEIRLNKISLINLLQDNPKLILKQPSEGHLVTPAQKRLWLLSKFDGGNKAYNISDILILEGNFHFDSFSKAISKLIARHESLRTYFKENEKGDLKQYVQEIEDVFFKVGFKDIGEMNEEEVHSLLRTKISTEIDLTKAPLMTIEVLKSNERRHLVVFNMHHIISDGWSLEILSRELTTLYNALLNSTIAELPELPIQYKDFAHWLNSKEQQEILEDSKNYWHRCFEEDIPTLGLPEDYPRPEVKTFNGAQITHSFPLEQIEKLRQFAKTNKATLFMGLMAALNGLFYRYSGQTDIVLGTPVAGRVHEDLEHQIGLYLNMLAIRTKFDGSDTFKTLLQKQKKTLLEAYDHQIYPFDLLVEELPIVRNSSRSPLFDIMVILQSQKGLFSTVADMAEIKVSSYRKLEKSSSQFDLNFSFVEGKGTLKVDLEYNADIYKPTFIQRMLNHLECFIANCIDFPEQRIASIEYISEVQRRLFLHRPEVGEQVLKEANLATLIESQCKKTPDNVALVYKNSNLTYKELQEKSNQLAHYLIQYHSVKPGDRVALGLNRNEWLIISLLAVLKTGAAYVPLDLNFPKNRISYIEQDSACKVTITDIILKDFSKMENLSNCLPNVNILPDSLAYVIYTSGSTGKPKGVMIAHSSVVSYLNWSVHEFADTDFDIMYAATTHCFDISVFEMFYPLSVGKKMRIIDNGLSIINYLDQDKNIFIHTVPSLMDSLLKEGVSLENVVTINLGGEALPISLSNTLTKFECTLRNFYGPTEDTIYSTCYLINKDHHGPIPIGKPIFNTKVYILSEGLSLQDIGIVGEIYLAGDGLSKGYFNREALTKGKFVENPYFPETLIYKTGDLGYWMPDGNLMFVGREDDQIKIHGHRIELGEIEHVLSEEGTITNAVVLIKEHNGTNHIVSYLTGRAIDIKEVSTSVSNKLPRYMLPSYYVILDEIPRTPNGKVDKKELLKYEVFKIKLSDHVPPQSEIEWELAKLWEQMLGLDAIGITDNFFELGGHSLMMNKMLGQIRTKFGVEIKFELFLKDPVIEVIALHIENLNILQSDYQRSGTQKVII